MSLAHTLFPLGLATGEAFCNRLVERRRLTDNLQNGRHTWLMAPRRYGKTSLLEQVLLDIKGSEGRATPAVSADLYICHDMEKLQDTLLDTVGKLTWLLGMQEGLSEKLKRFYKNLHPDVQYTSADGWKVRFFTKDTRIENILAALEGLDRAAGARNTRAVLVIDEFQQLGELPDFKPVEATIRHAAERARHVTYVFSGSQRRLLARMFEDSTRPLYQLCEKLELSRIDTEDYARFLQNAARRRWDQQLDEFALEAIMKLTARHPNYINHLCSRLWRADAQLPDEELIEKEWSTYVRDERNRIMADLRGLTIKQRAVFAAIAEKPTNQPTSRKFVQRTRIPSATIKQVIQVLADGDLVYTDDDGMIRVLDPAIGWYLKSPRIDVYANTIDHDISAFQSVADRLENDGD